MKKLITTVLLAGIVALLFLSVRLRILKRERMRLQANQEVLLSDVAYYRTANSLHAAGVNRLSLTNREFKEHCADLEKEVTALRLQVKRLQAVSQTATSAVYPIKTVIRDRLLPGRTDTVACLDFRNDYLTLAGCVEEGRFSGYAESRDTLIQIIHRVPRRFWFIRWGTKAIRQEVVSRNPYSQITYTKYIELKRK